MSSLGLEVYPGRCLPGGITGLLLRSPELSFLYHKPSICSLGLQHYSLLIKGPCSVSKQLQFL